MCYNGTFDYDLQPSLQHNWGINFKRFASWRQVRRDVMETFPMQFFSTLRKTFNIVIDNDARLIERDW